jgi:hypothetical protein
MTVSNYDESVGGAIGSLAARMNDLRMAIAASSMSPTQNPISGSGLTDSSGNVWIGVGHHCPEGRTWYVRQMAIGGTTWSTTATGTAIVAVMPASPQADQQPSTNYVRDAVPPIGGGSSTLPAVAWYDAGQFVVRSKEGLYVYITNGSAASGTAYVVRASIDVLPATGSTIG